MHPQLCRERGFVSATHGYDSVVQARDCGRAVATQNEYNVGVTPAEWTSHDVSLCLVDNGRGVDLASWVIPNLLAVCVGI